MNDKNNGNGKGRVSKKLQQTLNFKPEEILHIISLEIELKTLPNDSQKVILYINQQKSLFLEKLNHVTSFRFKFITPPTALNYYILIQDYLFQNQIIHKQNYFYLKQDNTDVNACLNVLFLEIFEMKKFYMKSCSQSSQLGEQMININKMNGHLQFCQQHVSRYSILLEQDIRGKSLILFYLLCEIYWIIEISDFSSFDEILKKYKKKVILFCSSFDYSSIPKFDRKSCNPSLIRFFASQLLGTIGLIQFEFHQLYDALNNLELSIKSRQENMEEKNILEYYLNSKQRIIEYELVIYYLKSKKCSCLLKMGRYAECSSFGNSTRLKIKSIMDSLDQSQEQKAFKEIAKQFKNLYIKVIETLEKSNESARHMLLDNDITDLLKEINGNEDNQNYYQCQISKDNLETSQVQKEVVESLQIESQQNVGDNTATTPKLYKLSLEKRKVYSNKIATLAHIPSDSKQSIILKQNSNAYSEDKRDRIEQMSDLQLLQINRNSNNQQQQQRSKEIDMSLKSVAGIQDTYQRANTIDQNDQERINSQNTFNNRMQLRVEGEDTYKQRDNSVSIANSNNFSLLIKAQGNQNDQMLQFNSMNSNRMFKSTSQHAVSAQTLQKGEEEEDNKFQNIQIIHKGAINSHLQSIYDKINSKRGINYKAVGERQQSDDKRRTQKRSPSKINITNISYFFKPQEQQNQISLGQMLSSNNHLLKKKRNLLDQDVNQFLKGICSSTSRQQNQEQLEEQPQALNQNLQQYQIFQNTTPLQHKNKGQSYNLLNTSTFKQFDNDSEYISKQVLNQFTERNQLDTENDINNQQFFITDTKVTEPNNPLYEVQRKLSYQHQQQQQQQQPYFQQETLNTQPSLNKQLTYNTKLNLQTQASQNTQFRQNTQPNLNTQPNYDQGMQSLKTLQTQQKNFTTATEYGEIFSNSNLKTEVAAAVLGTATNNKARKKYQKMTIEQFQPFEVKHLIVNSQTERSHTNQDGYLTSGLAPPPQINFQFKPELYEKIPDFNQNQQVSSAQSYSPMNKRQLHQNSQSSSSIQIIVPQQIQKRDSNPNRKYKQFSDLSSTSPSRALQNNKNGQQQSKEQLFKQISNYSYLRSSQNLEYQLFDQQKNDNQNEKQFENKVNVDNITSNQNINNNQNIQNNQKRQMNFTRSQKIRKSSISPSPSIIVSQVDQLGVSITSRQQSQKNISSFQEILLNRETSKEKQNDSSKQNLIVPRIMLEKLQNDPYNNGTEEAIQIESIPQTNSIHRIQSPSITPRSLTTSQVFANQNIKNMQTSGNVSQRGKSPSYSQQQHKKNQQFLQIPSSLSGSNNNSRDRYNISQMFGNKKRKRYSRSSHNHNQNNRSAHYNSISHLRKRFLSSHDRDSQEDPNKYRHLQNVTPRSPNSFAGIFQGSFMNSLTTGLPAKSTTIVSSTVSMNAQQPNPFQVGNFNRNSNDLQVKEMLTQRPDFYDDNLKKSINSTQISGGRKKYSISAHTRARRPATASQPSHTPHSKSISQNQNMFLENSSNQNNMNFSGQNYLSSLKASPIQSFKIENNSVISDPLINQIQVRQKYSMQRPISSQPYLNKRIKHIALQQTVFNSTSNLSMNTANFTQYQTNNVNTFKQNNLPLQPQLQKASLSCKSRIQENNFDFVNFNQQQTSALNVVLNEIEFQRNFDEAMNNQKVKDQQRNKRILRNIMLNDGKNEDGETTLLEVIENASQIIDENNKQNNMFMLQKKLSLESLFGGKSYRRIRTIESNSNKTISQNRILLSKQLSIEQHAFFEKDQIGTEQQFTETINQDDSAASGAASSQLKNSQLEKLRMELQQNNQEILMETVDVFPQKEGQKNSKTDLNMQKKSRFAKPKRIEVTTPKKQNKALILSFQGQMDMTSSFNVIHQKFNSRSKQQGSQNSLKQAQEDQKEGQKLDQLDKQNLNNSKFIGVGCDFNYPIQEEIQSGQFLNYQGDSVLNKDQDLLVVLKTEGQEDNASIKSLEATRHKRTNKDSLLINSDLYQKSSYNQQPEVRTISKHRNSMKEGTSPYRIDDQSYLKKQWHSKKHKLKIKMNSNSENQDKLIKKMPQSESSQGMITPVAFTQNNFDSLKSSLAVPESCSNTTQYISKRMNVQMKVPKNLDFRRLSIKLPSNPMLEVSTLSKINGINQSSMQKFSVTPQLGQNSMLISSRAQLSFQQKNNLDKLRTEQYFNNVRMQSQLMLQSRKISNDDEDDRNQKKKAISLFKLLEETNRSYEVRDKFVNSISGLINGLPIMNTTLCYPSITYNMYNNGRIYRVRLSINFTKNEIFDDKIGEIKEQNKSKITIEAKSIMRQSEFDIPSEGGTFKNIVEKSEEGQKDVEVEFVIQFENNQKIFIPMNLKRGLLAIPMAEHRLLITVWPLIYQDFTKYMLDNHLIDINDKDFLGIDEDEENNHECKITTYEDKQVIKSLLSQQATSNDIKFRTYNSSSNSQNQLLTSQNKLPAFTPRPQQLHTLCDIPILDDYEKDSNPQEVNSKQENAKKYQTMMQIPNRIGEINLQSQNLLTGDSNVNRKLQYLKEQFEDLKINFKMFGGLEQYFARENSIEAQTIVQKRKKKVISLIDMFDITELKKKVDSFLNFSFARIQKEIGKAFCQDVTYQSYYRYYLKHLLYVKRQYVRTQIGLIEFPDEDSTLPMFLGQLFYHNMNTFNESQSIIAHTNQPSLRFLSVPQTNSKVKTPSLSQQSINFKLFDKPFDEVANRRNQFNRESNFESSSSYSLVSEEENESITLKQNDQQNRKFSIANANVRKAIFCNHNQQRQAQINYFLCLKETQGFIQKFLEGYIKQTPTIILTFLKKNQGQYFLIVTKLVIKQEALFNKLFNEEGEIDIKDNYYFFITARTLNSNLKMRSLLPPIEIQQEQLKPYFYQSDCYQGIDAQINRFLMHGQMKKQSLQTLLNFFKKQIGITPFDKSENSSKANKQKIIFKDTIMFGQKMQASDWNSTFAQNLELYNIIFRQFQGKSISEGTPTSEQFIYNNYSHFFLSSFNEVYQEQIKTKRAALSLFHNYDDNDTDDDKMEEQDNKYQEQLKKIKYNLPKLNTNDLEQNNNKLDVPESNNRQSLIPALEKKRNSLYEEIEPDDSKLTIIKYFPYKIQQFMKKKREWFLKIGFNNKMRVNFNYKWDIATSQEYFHIFLYDQTRLQKFSIQNIPIKVKNILIRLIKLNKYKYPYFDIKSCLNLQHRFLQYVIQFEKIGLIGSKPLIKQNKEINLNNLIITSQKSIKEHLISNSSEISKYYQCEDCQFYMNMNILGKCIGTLRFHLMRRPIFNQEQMYVFMLIIQPLNSKTKQIKFAFSFQDLIMIDTNGEVTEGLKCGFTRNDMTKVIKIITQRIRMTRGLFGSYPVLMTEKQADIYMEYKKENQKERQSEQKQKNVYQKLLMQRNLSQQQQLFNANSNAKFQSPSNSISMQAQYVRSQRPSLFSKINSLFLKDPQQQQLQQQSQLTLTNGDQSTSRRKSLFFEEANKFQNNIESSLFTNPITNLNDIPSNDSSHSSESTSQHNQSPNFNSLNQQQTLVNRPSQIPSLRSPRFQQSPGKFEIKRFQIKKPPKLDLGRKESILTFSQKLIDMNIVFPPQQTPLLYDSRKIVLPQQKQNQIDHQESQEPSNLTPFQLKLNISPTTVQPIMNFLKNKKEIKSEVKQNINNQYLLTDQVQKFQSSSIRSSISSQGTSKQKNDPSQVMRRTESIDSYKESNDQNTKKSNEVHTLQVNQPVRNPNRKVSFAEKSDELTETNSKMSNSQAFVAQQHGILKNNKQLKNQDDLVGLTSPKVHFKVSENVTGQDFKKVKVQSVKSPKIGTQQESVFQNSEDVELQSPNQNGSSNNKIGGVGSNNIIKIIKSDLQDNNMQDVQQEQQQGEDLRNKNEESIQDYQEEEQKNQQLDILEKLKGQMQKKMSIKKQDDRRNSIQLKQEMNSQSQQSLDKNSLSFISEVKSNTNASLPQVDSTSDIIFQDLRVFRNMISRHDFSDGKQNISSNKGFLETYMQKARIIGQYVRRMANNEYVLITVRKDFILKCWDIQLYIPKTQRVLLSQISHSELIDCSYDFLNKHISSKLIFFYENKNMKPFDNYLAFLNRVNQFSDNRMQIPDKQQRNSVQQINLSRNNLLKDTINPSFQPKVSILGSIISKLKKAEEIPSPELLKQKQPSLISCQKGSKLNSPKHLPQPNNSEQINPNDQSLLYSQKFSLTKMHIQQLKERDQSLQKRSSIDDEIIQEEAQTFFNENHSIRSRVESNKQIIEFKQTNSNRSIPSSPSPAHYDQGNLNYLSVPNRSPKKKVSLIKLVNIDNIDDDETLGKEEDYSNNSKNQQKLNQVDTNSNLAIPSDHNGDNTPRSSTSSRIGLKSSLFQNNNSPTSLLSKMIESSMRKGQRRLTFKLEQQQNLLKQQAQQILNRNVNSFEDQQSMSSLSKYRGQFYNVLENQDDSLARKISSEQRQLQISQNIIFKERLPIKNDIKFDNQANQNSQSTQSLEQPQINLIIPHQENHLQQQFTKKIFEKPEIQQSSQVEESEDNENEGDQFLIRNLISDKPNKNEQKQNQYKTPQQQQQPLQQLSTIHSTSQGNTQDVQNRISPQNIQTSQDLGLIKQHSLLSTIRQKSRVLSRNDSLTEAMNENLTQNKNRSISMSKVNVQRLKNQMLFHSNSLAESSENLRSGSKSQSTQENVVKPLIGKQLKFSPQLKKQQSINSLPNQQQSLGPAIKTGQKRNLKSLISQNQQKIVGERNLNALVDFMKPKQFEKLFLQQKMQAITEDIDISFMTGCPNERIDRLVRFIEIKIWSNFLSQCEFRTDDKHFKVVLFFGSNRLNLQEQLFHEYVRVDQNNESVIEIDVELQESVLIMQRDPTLSTRVQLLQYFFTSFRSIPYTITSNFSFTVQNVIINKGTIKKFNVNVRELLNLFIAEGFYRFQTNYMSSKVSYSELKNLAYFLIHKIKSSNFLELMKTQVKNYTIDKAQNRNESSSNLQRGSSVSPTKSNFSNGTIHSFNNLPDVKGGGQHSTAISLQYLGNLSEKKRQKIIQLQDDNIIYYFESIINVHLRLVMRVSYFTRGLNFQIQVNKCGTTLSVVRYKTLNYFKKKIPFVSFFMKKMELFDTALSRIGEFMKPKMILYFIIQHNIPLDQKYFTSITKTQEKRKQFSAFSMTHINSEANSSAKNSDIDEHNEFDSDNDDDQSYDEEIHSISDNMKQQFDYQQNLQQHYDESQNEKFEVEYFSSKNNISPLKLKRKEIQSLSGTVLEHNQRLQDNNDSRSESCFDSSNQDNSQLDSSNSEEEEDDDYDEHRQYSDQ